MAALSAQDRLEGAGEFMRDPATGTMTACTKADIRAAFNALDDFLVANAAAVNNAIPQPAKANLTTSQKAQLLCAVVTKRYIKGA